MTDTSITPADIEAKLRDIQGQVDVVAGDSKKKAAIGALVATVLALLVVYFLGRRTGKRKSTVVEIRRI